MTSSVKKIGLGIAVLILIAGVWYGPSAVRLYRVIHLYDEDRIAEDGLATMAD